nr:unnamed protein product [Callosobruchus analis]
MLAGYELKEEVKLFLNHQNKKEPLQMFENEKSADIFEFLDHFNLKFQGRNTTILPNYDNIQGFLAKLQEDFLISRLTQQLKMSFSF